MCEDNWTAREEERQDCVDNTIFNFIQEFCGDNEVEWDIEDIANIREVLQGIIVDKLKLMTEQEFYPYRELKPENDGNIILEPSEEPEPERLVVTVDDLDKAIKQAVNDLGFDDLAKVASDFLGGFCEWDEGDNFIFVTDENYNGALDFVKGKHNG